MRLCRTLLLTFLAFIADHSYTQWAPLNAGSFGRSMTTYNGNIFVAAPPNGIRKSTNDGVTWTLANTGLPMSGSNYQVQSVGHSATALFCGTENGVFRSTDNGASWMSVNNTLPTSSNTIYCNRIYTFGNGTFLVYTGQLNQNGGGVFRTFDNGTTWLQAFSGLSSNMTVNSLAQVDGVLYAATSTGLMRSDDLGGSWQAAGTTNWAVQAVQGSGNNLVILGAFGAQRSVNGGTSWTNATGYPNTNAPQGSDLVVYDGQFYAITKTGASGCYRSVDNGATWAAFNDGLSPQNTFVQEEFHAGDEHLYMACALDCYRIPSLTTGLTNKPSAALPVPYPTVFHDQFQIDLSTFSGELAVVLIDAVGREVSRTTLVGGGLRSVPRSELAAGRYNCLLHVENSGVTHNLGQVIAE
jgi:hypothetical protein